MIAAVDFSGLIDAVRRIVREEIAAARSPTAEMVTLPEFARARRLSLSTVRKAIREGRLDATKIGRSVRVRADAEIGKPVHLVSAGDGTAAAADWSARAARIIRGGR